MGERVVYVGPRSSFHRSAAADRRRPSYEKPAPDFRRRGLAEQAEQAFRAGRP